eukprot:scpid42301/ scgid17889/ 
MCVCVGTCAQTSDGGGELAGGTMRRQHINTPASSAPPPSSVHSICRTQLENEGGKRNTDRLHGYGTRAVVITTDGRPCQHVRRADEKGRGETVQFNSGADRRRRHPGNHGMWSP